MRARLLFCCGLLIFFSAASGQVYEGQVDSALLPVLNYHYQDEFTLDNSTDPGAWRNQHGPHVGFGSTNERYFRTEAPQLNENATWQSAGWRGERLNAQVAVWSADTLEQVRFLPGALKTEDGAMISRDNITVNMVRYVLGNYPYGSDKGSCGDSPYKDGFLMPDRFEDFDRFDVPGKTVRPVWISINIPEDAKPGRYAGTIEVRGKGFTRSLKVDVEVQNQLLPPPHDWQFRLDLWQNPWVVAWQNHLRPWSKEHMVLLKQHLKLYADAGGKYVTTYAVNSPWNDNSYSIEGGMIEPIREKDSGWKFDYGIFDQYVALAMSVGIDKAITIYTPVPDSYRFRYRDAATGDYVTVYWAPGSDHWRAYWGPFLNSLKQHLAEKGWLNKTYIGINENPLDETLTAIRFVKSNWSGWKITYAGDWHPELKDLLDDYSYVKEKESPMDVVAERKRRGQTTTFYICCQPAKPNTFIFSPPVEGRWI
ncbi:MAG TPA: glycoside hydrolase domain-containing protein, partial [Puia sp.]|nr:glycoside hydrolase domain-containing protein [Puia sp.]